MQNASRNRISNYKSMELDNISYFYNNGSPSIYSRKVGIEMARKNENQRCESKSKSSRQSTSKSRSKSTKKNNR